MTDNEIIKALGCCVELTSDCRCCPAYELANGDCIDITKKGAIDLINRQKAEIKRLQETIFMLTKTGRFYSTVRAEAIKEFAERLCEDRVSNDPVVIAVKCELNEMVGDQNV